MLSDRQRRIPTDFYQSAQQNSQDQWIIDGYEQLGWWARRRLERHCKRYGSGLLVTSHQSTGLPTIWRTTVDAELAHRVVAYLAGQSGLAKFTVPDNRLLESLDSNGGNLREVLFDLYDFYEQHRGDLHRGEP